MAYTRIGPSRPSRRYAISCRTVSWAKVSRTSAPRRFNSPSHHLSRSSVPSFTFRNTRQASLTSWSVQRTDGCLDRLHQRAALDQLHRVVHVGLELTVGAEERNHLSHRCE